MAILRAESDSDVAAIAELFSEYAASLPVDLGYQSFEAELAGLPGAYAPPHGALFLAIDNERQKLGCVALRPTAAQSVCEMKRLYLLPQARGLGVGRQLADAAIDEARRIGYREIRLDTLPSMDRAIAMYGALGFVTVEAYYAPTPPGTIFLAKTL